MVISGTTLSMTRGDNEAITVARLVDGIAEPFVNGDTVYFTIKHSANTDVKVLQKEIIVFTDGKAIIELLPADTKELTYKTYKYDIQLTDHHDIVTTLVKYSDFIITEEITNE